MTKQFEKWIKETRNKGPAYNLIYAKSQADFWLRAFVREIKDRQALRPHHDIRLTFNEIVRDFGLEEGEK